MTTADSNAPVILQRKVVASFKRHLNLGDYNHAELFMSVEDYVDLEANAELVSSKLRELAAAVKATCIDEVGLEFEVREDGVVLEVLRQQFGAQTEVVNAASNEITSPRATLNVAPTPPHDPKSLNWREASDKPKLAENRAWAAQQFLVDSGAFYDNRADKPKESSPDYKHKSSGITIWQSDVDKARKAAA